MNMIPGRYTLNGRKTLNKKMPFVPKYDCRNKNGRRGKSRGKGDVNEAKEFW